MPLALSCAPGAWRGRGGRESRKVPFLRNAKFVGTGFPATYVQWQWLGRVSDCDLTKRAASLTMHMAAVPVRAWIAFVLVAAPTLGEHLQYHKLTATADPVPAPSFRFAKVSAVL